MAIPTLSSSLPVGFSVVPPRVRNLGDTGTTAGAPRGSGPAPIPDGFTPVDEAPVPAATKPVPPPPGFSLTNPEDIHAREQEDPNYVPNASELQTIYAAKQAETLPDKALNLAKGVGEGAVQGVKSLVVSPIKAVGELYQKPSLEQAGRVASSVVEGASGAASGLVSQLVKASPQAMVAREYHRLTDTPDQAYNRWQLDYLNKLALSRQSISESFQEAQQKALGNEPGNTFKPLPYLSDVVNQATSLAAFGGAMKAVAPEGVGVRAAVNRGAEGEPGAGVSTAGTPGTLVDKAVSTAGAPQPVSTVNRAMGAGGKVAEAVGGAAKTVGALPRHAIEAVVNKIVGPELAEKATAIGEGALASHVLHGGGPLAAVAAGSAALEGGGAALKSAGQIAQRLATADPANPWGRLVAISKDTSAPGWMRSLAVNPVVKTAASAAEMTAPIVKNVAAGAAVMGVPSILGGDDAETVGENFGSGAAMGGAFGALHAPGAQRAAVFRRQLGALTELTHAHLAEGIPADTLKLVPDAAMIEAATLQKLGLQNQAGEPLKIRFVDPATFNAKGGAQYTGADAFHSPGENTIYLNADQLSKNNSWSTLFHEAIHPLFDSEIANRPELKQQIDAAVAADGKTLAQAKSIYAFQLVKPQLEAAGLVSKRGGKDFVKDPVQVQAAVDAAVTERNGMSAQAYGDENHWIYSEIMAEAGKTAMRGKSVAGVVEGDSILGRLKATAAKVLLDTVMKLGVTTKASRKPGTIIPGFENVISDPSLRKATYDLLRAQKEFLPGISTAAPQGVKVTKDMWGKSPAAPLHDLGNGVKGNDFVIAKPDGTIVNRRAFQTKRIINTRRGEMNTIFPANGVPLAQGDASPKVSLRRSPSGKLERSGTVLGDEFQKATTVGVETKAMAKAIEAAIAAGKAFTAWYQQIGKGPDWKASVGKDTGNVEAQLKDFIPYGFLVDKAGNILVRNYSLSAFDRKAAQWAGRNGDLSLELWDNDITRFKSDVQTYLSNHEAGLPGESNNLGVEKKNLINAFLVGDNRTFDVKNPLRVKLKGENRQGIIRSYRLDRLETLEPFDTQFAKPEYGKQLQNFSPADHSAKDLKEVPLVHISSQTNLKKVSPLFFGKGKANRNDLSGAGKSYFFVKGSKLQGDAPIFGSGGYRSYNGSVPGVKLYDLRKGKSDPLGYFDQMNREKADETVKSAGYDGILVGTEDGRKVVMMYKPVPVSNEKPFKGGVAYSPQTPNEDVRKVSEDYMKAAGLSYKPYTDYAPLNEDLGKRVADFYEAAKHEPESPAVKASYDALAKETVAQYNAAVAAGMKFEPWKQPGQPYKNSEEMAADVRDNKHLWYFPTEGGFGQGKETVAHPMLADSGVKIDGQPVPVNDLFRAIHDFYGHAKEGYGFGPRGEYNAFLAHSRMFSDAARPAMGNETMGQNSWVNFGKHLRDEKGNVPKKGELGYKALEERPFAEQKATVLPDSVLRNDVQFSPPQDPSKEHIKEAAIRLADGRIFTGLWHGDAYTKAAEAGAHTDENTTVAGFTTSTGRFLNRRDAYALGRSNGQLPPEAHGIHLAGDTKPGLESFEFRDKRNFSPKSEENAPVYYSQLRKVVDAKFSGKEMPAAQLAAIIRNPQNGVKADELKWSGLDDFLKGKQRVTREEVSKFMEANQLQVKEIQHGGVGKVDPADVEALKSGLSDLHLTELNRENFEDEVDQKHFDEYWAPKISKTSDAINFAVKREEWDDANRLLSRLNDHYDNAGLDTTQVTRLEQLTNKMMEDTQGDSTKFEKYVLPGGENYREFLFTLPEQGRVDLTTLPAGYRAEKTPENFSRAGHLWQVINEDGGAIARGETEHEATYKALALLNKDRKTTAQSTRFKSSHWDESNVVAHTRVDDRTDSAGKPGLFTEEIQSDWHLAGRKEGYKNSNPRLLEKLTDQFRALKEEALNKGYKEENGYWSNPAGEVVAMTKFGTGIQTEDPYLKPLVDTYKEYRQNMPSSSAVPDAPYKTSWHEFLFRRLVRMAAEEGKDWLGWTTGEQTAERYDLSKQVDSIKITQHVQDFPARSHWHYFNKDGELYGAASEETAKQRAKEIGGTAKLVPYDASKEVAYTLEAGSETYENLTPDKLEEYVGRDIVSRAVAKLEKQNQDAKGTTDKYPDLTDAEKAELTPLRTATHRLTTEQFERLKSLNRKQQLHQETWSRPDEGNPDQVKLSGLDLKMGGEWAYKLYDEMLVSYANKFGKKFGAQVEDRNLSTGRSDLRLLKTTEEVNATNPREYEFYDGVGEELDRHEAFAVVSDGQAVTAVRKSGESKTVHSISITPEMKKSVLSEGVALFSPKAGADATKLAPEKSEENVLTGSRSRAKLPAMTLPTQESKTPTNEKGWLAPDGKFYPLGGVPHELWARQATGNLDREGSEATQDLYKKGWFRISPMGQKGVISSTENGVQPTASQEKTLRRLHDDNGLDRWVHASGIKDQTKASAQFSPATEKIDDKLADRYAKRIESVVKSDGALTFNVATGKNISNPKTEVYGVSIYPDRSKIFEPEDKISAADLSSFIKDNYDLLAEPHNSVGVWRDPASGKTYLDVSWGTPDRKLAEYAGHKYNQIAVWDGKAKKEIPTGGTGATIDHLLPAGDRVTALAHEYELQQGSGELPGVGKLILDPAGPEVKNTRDLEQVHPDRSLTPNELAASNEAVRNLRERVQLLPTVDARIRVRRALQQGFAEVSGYLKKQSSNKAFDSGSDWYGEDIKKMEATTHEIFPETKDPDKMTLFKVLLATLSPSQTPKGNYAVAAEAFAQYQKTGKFTGTSEKRISEAGKARQLGVQAVVSADTLNGMKEELGGEKPLLNYLLSKHAETKLGHKDAYGALDLGPKVGRFFLNLTGHANEVTIDMWATRTWNRWMGTPFRRVEDSKGGSRMELADMPTDEERELAIDAFTKIAGKVSKHLGEDVSPMEVQAILWFYEKDLFARGGAKVDRGLFSKAATDYQENPIHAREGQTVTGVKALKKQDDKQATLL